MKERPILFSAPMVRAILAGSKTQTRRALAPDLFMSSGGAVVRMASAGPATTGIREAHCPYWREPGDRLWVKEQTLKVEDHGWIGPVYTESDAGRDALAWGYGEADDPDHIPPHAIKRRPSIFMTRAMSRIELEVTGVRVERLKDISEADAVAEGAPSADLASGRECIFPHQGTHRWGFRLLWESINGPGSWDANPWCWVIEFRRLP